MSKKMRYDVMQKHAVKINELVANEKYRSSDVFIDLAVNMMLTWESENPGDVIKIMQSMMPFTVPQEKFMQGFVDKKLREEHFRMGESETAIEELKKQKQLEISDFDHVRLQNNFDKTSKFISQLEITKPENIYEYDGYPLLFRFYSRFFPVKIVITVLANMMYEKNQTKIKLEDFRMAAYDIAEEISWKIANIERDSEAPRNKKISTGLPKKAQASEDIVKKAQAQKRFKDQYIGRLRKNRVTKKEHIEGALGALGLIYAFEENGETYVTLTEKGRKFSLMPNPAIRGDFRDYAITKEESEFILSDLLPSLDLEKEFIDTAVRTIKKPNKKSRITDVLDEEFLKTIKKYKAKNPKKTKDFDLNILSTLSDDATKRRIVGWRVATMGRMSELRMVNWEINEKGESQYSLN
ncbi:MAG: hypothetical protein IIA83_01040 [Thaumarchaeota archaeon]|nr:hypothetical protein [Nitrososphaerota archaeon]MCH9042276.1 hypothetical protein [Nitrososphaerota archaeon]